MNKFPNVSTVEIFGVPFSKLGMTDTVDLCTRIVKEGRPCQIITGNPIMLMAALENPAYMEVMKRAELIVPDGTGIVWAAGKIGNPVAERVPGFDLMHRLFERSVEKGWRVFLLGSSKEVIQAARDTLVKSYPALQIAVIHDCFFGSDGDVQVIETIRKANPQLLFVGRSAVTQEPWIDKFKQELGVPLMMGVGGSFDVISGKIKRAPSILQQMRLEWFYRLLQEPWRYKRMLALPKFVVRVMRERDKLQEQ